MIRTTRPRGVAAALVTAAAIVLTGCMPSTTSTGAAPTVRGVVVAVVDGDTIRVDVDGGGVERVRLLGIDAPEVGRDGAASECFAEESHDILDGMLSGQRVTLTADPTQDDADRYDRLLRYVDIGDVDAAAALVEAGGAAEYTFNAHFERRAAYVDAEADAQGAARGMWSPACD